MTESSFLMLMHLSQFAGFILPIAGFVAPIIMWVTNKDNSASVDLHGKNIINFMISYAIYGAVLCITIIGIPVAIVLGILYLVFVVLASIKASNGEFWKYPLSIQFLK